VVRDDVEDVAHAVGAQCVAQPAVGLGAAELLVQPAVVDDVVAVGAPRRGLEVRRAVEVADAEIGEVRHDRRRVVEGEPRVQLHAVGRPHVGHRQPS
jgi:hypothetical protein